MVKYLYVLNVKVDEEMYKKVNALRWHNPDKILSKSDIARIAIMKYYREVFPE